MSSAVHLIIRGRVQGVSFRAGAQEQALEIGVCGWTRNCPDETVEIHAEAEKEILKPFITWCRKGTLGADVEALELEWVQPRGFSTFEIRN